MPEFVFFFGEMTELCLTCIVKEYCGNKNYWARYCTWR